MDSVDRTSLMAECLAYLAGSYGGDWALMFDGDNLVFCDSTRVVKVAKHPDGRARLANGVTAAERASAHGVPVVAPLSTEVHDTPIGPLSLWPRIQHEPATAATLTRGHGAQLGSALAHLAQVQVDPAGWDPLGRIGHRFDSTTAPVELVQRARDLAIQLAFDPTPTQELRFAHGDISTGNVLFTADGALLIDLDSAGPRPGGWDLACLDLHLVREAGNADAYAGVLHGWAEVAPVPEVDERLVALKAFMATTFQLTFEPTTDRLTRIADRLEALENWRAGSGLDRVPPGR